MRKRFYLHTLQWRLNIQTSITALIIKENSWIAKLAAWKLKADAVAIVVGKTVHLHNCKRQQFLGDKRWVKHELCHIRQFQEHGFMGFIFKYLLESIKHGYYNNKYEIEARQAERDVESL